MIQRRASRLKGGASRAGNQRSTRFGSLTIAQRYKLPASSHTSATQAPFSRRLTNTPMGQGSAAQHTPQPLHAAPTAGLAEGRCAIMLP